MKRLSKVAMGTVTAGAMLVGGALPALASGGTTAVATPPATFQGSSFAVTTHCPSASNRSLIGSRLFGVYALPTGDTVVHVMVGRTVTPAKYRIGLWCFNRWSGKVTGTAHTWIRVLRWNRHTPPPGPGPLPKANFFISTGFGGMARSVASHHPVA
jgi:hypothetical protein